MAAGVMGAVTVMAVVAMCIMGDTFTAGVVTCTMVMVGQAMPITDPLMAGDMLAPATDMRIGHAHHGHGRWHNGHWYAGNGRWWRGHYYAYGVGSCWRFAPAGWVWVCY